MDAPTKVGAGLRADCESLFSLFGRTQEGDGLLVGLVWMVEEMGHEILAYGWEQIAGLVDVFVFPPLRWHVWDLADVDQISWMQFKLRSLNHRLSVPKSQSLNVPARTGCFALPSG